MPRDRNSGTKKRRSAGRSTRGLGPALLLCAMGLPALADGETPRRPEELERVIRAAFAERDYPAAAAACREATARDPRRPDHPYNLACALARLQQIDEAIAALDVAVERGFSDAGQMRDDPDLEPVRGDPRFEKLAERAAVAEAEAVRRLPYDKPRDIPGVNTVERDPPGGLRYRVRKGPDATAAHPHRLIVWLHPSGGSMNGTVEQLAPRLAKRGWALLTLTQKQFMGWSPAEAARLMKHTLPDAARIEGLDVRRPVLFGYSAGGQMAIAMWQQRPDAFAGLVLDAAYPLAGTDAAGRPVPLTVPEDEPFKDVPLLVFVGERDGGAKLWKAVQPRWEQAGIPLTVHVVGGKGHAWLLGPPQVAKLEDWLDRLRRPQPD